MMYLLIHGLLVIAWLTLTGTYTLGNTVFAVVVGYILMATVERRQQSRTYTKRIPAAIALLFYFLYELTKANAVVAWEMIDPRHTMKPGIVAVPLDLQSPVAITVLANLITLTPGTLSLDVSEDHKTLYVHGMYVGDPDQFRKDIKQGFERRVKEVLE